MNMTFVIVQAIHSYALLSSMSISLLPMIMLAISTKQAKLKFVHYFFRLKYRDA